ncbi:hypothetical protein [Streptomyces sp. NPDC004135]
MKTETSRFEVVEAEDGDLPIDVELISDATESALALRLGTTTREDIDAKTPALVGHLQMLLGEELGANEDVLVMDLFRKAYTVLDLKNRPTQHAPAFAAFIFMREVADLTRRLLWIYTEPSRHET